MKRQKQHGCHTAACWCLSWLPQRKRENKGGRTKEKREDVQLRPNQLLLLVWGGEGGGDVPALPSCKLTPVQTRMAV